ncbi:hypothetical protein [Candidatus Burkholderia verschuerenii]|uniref:hypothetical protein n=1 Tax=Candidatus Burkholderia verschuerenii TaxID=242163 RepID=UPI0012EE9AA2|nr:hypothetical protein [Candidatus Burkholderia verschuerenii]
MNKKEIRASMTNEQILLERKLTCEAIDGALAFGYQNTNPPPDDEHWLARFWKIGRKQAELEAALSDACNCDSENDEPVETIRAEGFDNALLSACPFCGGGSHMRLVLVGLRPSDHPATIRFVLAGPRRLPIATWQPRLKCGTVDIQPPVTTNRRNSRFRRAEHDDKHGASRP